jgi:hypothetical protein
MEYRSICGQSHFELNEIFFGNKLGKKGEKLRNVAKWKMEG